MQYSIDNGTTWYWTNNTTGTNTMQNTPVVGSTGTTFTIAPTIAGITGIIFRFHVNEGLTYTSAGGTGVVITPSNATSFVSLRKRIFYGATASMPTNGSQIRSLPFSLLGPTSGSSIANTTSDGSNRFSFPSGTQYNTFVIALPDSLVLNGSTLSYVGVVRDGSIYFGESNPNNDVVGLTTGIVTVPDASGVNHNYNVYTYVAGGAFSSDLPFVVAYNGVVDA
jgi:hypothetical protein